MTFAEHVEAHRREDGTYDLKAAEDARCEELQQDQAQLTQMARKVAQKERRDWESQQTEYARKQYSQLPLSLELEMMAKILIGESTAVQYGEMDHVRIKLRKDLRLKAHLDENSAFDSEMRHWLSTEPLLEPGETIRDAQRRMLGPENN